MDLKLVWGWQKGAYLTKLTHISYGLTFFFLLVATLCDLGLKNLAPFQRNLMYWSLSQCLFIDIGFYIVEAPRIKEDFSYHSWIGTHKHFVNLLWILGVTAEDVPIEHSKVDFIMYGFLLPTLTHVMYYLFAVALKNKRWGRNLLHVAGVPLPDSHKTEVEAWQEEIEPMKRGNITAYPGEWIYPAFNSLALTILFHLSFFLLAPLNFGLLLLVNKSKGFRTTVLFTATVITPLLYSDEYDGFIMTEFVARLLGIENLDDSPPIVFTKYYDLDVWISEVWISLVKIRETMIKVGERIIEVGSTFEFSYSHTSKVLASLLDAANMFLLDLFDIIMTTINIALERLKSIVIHLRDVKKLAKLPEIDMEGLREVLQEHTKSAEESLKGLSRSIRSRFDRERH